MYADFNIIDRNTIRVTVYKGERDVGLSHTHHASGMFCDIGSAYIWLRKQAVLPQKVQFTWGENV